MSDARDPDFYLEQASYVRNLARRLVYDSHAADDLFQAAWLAALQRPARDGAAPRRWLARIVRNLASKAWLSARRRREREQHRDPPPPSSSPADVLAHEHERRRVVEALLALDEPYRAALIARFFDGLEPAAIAARDGVPVETVRTRQKRALERLRERLLRGSGSAVALVHGLRLDAPDVRAVLVRIGNGMLLMQATKKVVLAAGLAMLAAVGWWALHTPPAVPDVGAAAPRPSPAAAALPAVEASVPVAAPALERTTAPAAAVPAPTGSLLVRVEWPDQRPAPDIAVRVGSLAASNFEASVVHARTDRDGCARFDRLAVGDAMVACDRGSQRQCAIRAGERTEARLAIERGVRVHGRVFDVDGRAAAGAEIYLLFHFVSHAGDVVARAAADGTFAIDDAPADRSFALSARLPQRAPTPQQVVTGDAGAAVDVELRFEARGGAVAGRVVDGDGEPVAGAVVLVGPDDAYELRKTRGAGRAPSLRSRRTSSDARGEWVVDGFAAGDAPVLVVAPGMAPWHGGAFVVEGAVVRCDAAMSRAARLAGSVRDERGAAVPRATVRVGQAGWGLQSASTTAAADGSFVLDGLPLGAFTAVALADGAGLARAEFTGTAGGTQRWDAVLSRATTLRGRVVAAGAGVAKARVAARCMPSAQQQWFQDVVTDAQGWFELTNCPEALLHLEARKHGSENFVVAQRDDVDARAGEVTLEVDPAREATAFAAGRVLDPDGKPVAGAEITLLPVSVDCGGGHYVRAGEDGRFRSPPCPPGEWFLTVRAAGRAQLGAPRRVLTAGAATDWGDLVLADGRPVVVTLQPDAGVDLDGLVVGLADANCGIASERPENGVVRFANIGPGDYVITAYARGAALRPLPLRVGAESETAVALRIVAGSEVTVDVRDARGEPMLDRLETELFDGNGACIDRSPMMPANGPMLWLRRLVTDRYELRLRDHLGRVVTVPLPVPAGGAPLRATARFP